MIVSPSDLGGVQEVLPGRVEPLGGSVLLVAIFPAIKVLFSLVEGGKGRTILLNISLYN